MPAVHFVNVSPGDCTIIRHGSGRVTMVDVCDGYVDLRGRFQTFFPALSGSATATSTRLPDIGWRSSAVSPVLSPHRTLPSEHFGQRLTLLVRRVYPSLACSHRTPATPPSAPDRQDFTRRTGWSDGRQAHHVTFTLVDNSSFRPHWQCPIRGASSSTISSTARSRLSSSARAC